MHMKSITLPKPTGQFQIGTIRYNLIDRSRQERYSNNKSYHRELLMQVWYPTNDQSSNRADYIQPASRAYIKKVLEEGKKSAAFINHPVHTHSYVDAKISSKQNKYPLILFSHGFGDPIYSYTSFLEELASHGFIVAAVEHTYRSEPTEFLDGRITGIASEWFGILTKIAHFEQIAHDYEMDVWVQDLQFAIAELEKINLNDPKDILTGAFDFSNLGAFGHSFGASAVVQLCRVDKRCKAIVNLDGALFGKNPTEPIDKPCMIILTGNYPRSNAEYEIFGGKEEFQKFYDRHMTMIDTLVDRITNDIYLITLQNARHMHFTDLSIFDESIDPSTLFKTRELLVYFFRNYLQK